MWPIDEIQLRPITIDINDAWQNEWHTTSLVADDVQICNHIGALATLVSKTQVLICEGCGMEGCADGGWVCLRRVGAAVAWIPVYSELDEETEHNDYPSPTPPDYFKDRGVPLISKQVWERLRGVLPSIPEIEAIPFLSISEALRLIQAEAPLQVLGRALSRPKLNRELLLAVSIGELSDEIEWVESFIQLYSDSPRTVFAVPSGDLKPVEFYLDAPKFPAWQPMCRIGDQVGLKLLNGPYLGFAAR